MQELFSRLKVLSEHAEQLLKPVLLLIDRVLPLPPPWGRYFVGAVIGILLFTFLMKLWEKIKPKPDITKASLKGKQARRVLKEARSAERAGHYLHAAECYKTTGKTEKALSLYRQAGANRPAGELLIQLGRTDEAISLWESTGNYALAAKKLADMKKFERAARNYERANNNPQAGEMYERAGMYEKAGEHYSKAGFHAKAAKCYEKAGARLPAAQAFERCFREQEAVLGDLVNPEKAKAIRNLAKRSGDYYSRAGKLPQAADIYMRGGFLADAAKMYEQIGETDRAAKLYREAGLFDEAARLLETGGAPLEAAASKAEALKAQGRLAEAAAEYARAEDYHMAADLYAQAEMYPEAADMLLKAGAYMDAGNILVQAGDRAKAAWAYEQARDYDTAARLYGEVGDIDGAARALAAGGSPIDAAKMLFRQRRPQDAYKILEDVPPDHPDYRQAAAIMAKMQASQNRVDAAVSLLQRAISGEPVSQDTIELYYLLGTMFEQRGDYALALDIYTKVLGENISFKDASARHQALRERMAPTSPAQSSPQAQAGGEHTVVFSEPQGGARANPRYRIQDELGRGGMGVVYKAHDSVLDRPVAYKVLPPDLKNHQEVVKKFNQEATALAKLLHPNIVTVFDAGGIGGEYYFVMEYIEGRNLKDIIRESRRPLPIANAVAIFKQLASALSYAHSKSIVHRDIKTSNVMLQDDGNVKLMDFGLAKILEGASSERTAVSGTPYYMSPEQTMGKGIDHRTDIYSLGVMMYELVTGRVPFPTGDVGYHHLHTEPEPPGKLRPDIPETLEAIILKCMRKKPEERYQSTDEILRELEKID